MLLVNRADALGGDDLTKYGDERIFIQRRLCVPAAVAAALQVAQEVLQVLAHFGGFVEPPTQVLIDDYLGKPLYFVARIEHSVGCSQAR